MISYYRFLLKLKMKLDNGMQVFIPWVTCFCLCLSTYPFWYTVALSSLASHPCLLTLEIQLHLRAHFGLSVIKYAYFLKLKVFSLNIISGKLFYRKWKSKINILRCHLVPSGQLFTVLQQSKLAKYGNWFSPQTSRMSELLKLHEPGLRGLMPTSSPYQIGIWSVRTQNFKETHGRASRMEQKK